MTGSDRSRASARSVVPRPLTKEVFAPFGEVIEATAAVEIYSINEGCTDRFHKLATLDLLREDGTPIVSIFRSRPKPTPIEIRLMERHPLGSQVFVPLSGRPYLVVVAHPRPEDIEVFLASPSQGVHYRAGTWHHYSLALDAPSDFLVIDREGPGANLDEVELAPRDRVQIDLSTLQKRD